MTLMLGACDVWAPSTVADDLHIWRHNASAARTAIELRAAGSPTARARAGPLTLSFFWVIIAIVNVSDICLLNTSSSTATSLPQPPPAEYPTQHHSHCVDIWYLVVIWYPSVSALYSVDIHGDKKCKIHLETYTFTIQNYRLHGETTSGIFLPCLFTK